MKSVKVAQSCLTFCDAMDYTPPGFSTPENLQARILEWVGISFFRGSSWPRDQTPISCTAGRFFTVWATRETQSCWDQYKVPEVSFDSNQLKKGFSLITLNLPSLKNYLQRPYGKCYIVRSKSEDAYRVSPFSRHLKNSRRRCEGLSNLISTFRMFLS